MNSRLILWLVLSVMAGCRCGERVDRAPELPVRVVPEVLGLGDVYVGRTRSLPLTLSNLDRSATSVRATGLAAPFTVDPSEVELAGSESLELLVNFAPTSPGVFDASLTFTDAAGRALAVSLRGTGVAVPACDAPPVCAATVFDFDSGACRTEALADGTACTASFACFAEAECQSGTCVGTLTTCDDRNACTLDACGETGCVHLDGALSCSVTDPCQATSCDPQLGCVSRPVEDGVPCGDATCETAAVCMSGTCQVRVRPNAMQDCRYTQVVADFDSACAVTEGRGVRCWGRNQPFDWLRRGFESWVAGPGFMQGIVDARSIASSDNLSWVALSSGETAGTVRSNVPLNAVSVAAACPNGACQICGLYQGSVSCVDSPGPNDAGARVVVSGGVTSLTMSNGFPPELCVVRAGEVSCGSESQLTPVPLPQLASMASSVFRGTACARLDDGSAWCWGAFGLADGGARVIWDAGVTALATNHDRFYSGAVCVATARGIECLPSNPFTQPDIRPVTTTPELGTITQLSVAQTVGCALLAGGQVACWGDNQVGQLGDRSAQPVGTRELPVRARWMHGFSSRVVFGFADGGAFTFGGTSADGGQSVLVDAGTKWLVPSLQAIEGSEVDYQGLCRRTAGEVFCGEFGPLPMPDATVFTTVHGVAAAGRRRLCGGSDRRHSLLAARHAWRLDGVRTGARRSRRLRRRRTGEVARQLLACRGHVRGEKRRPGDVQRVDTGDADPDLGRTALFWKHVGLGVCAPRIGSARVLGNLGREQHADHAPGRLACDPAAHVWRSALLRAERQQHRAVLGKQLGRSARARRAFERAGEERAHARARRRARRRAQPHVRVAPVRTRPVLGNERRRSARRAGTVVEPETSHRDAMRTGAMMGRVARFADALESHPAPSSLGDVTLRYEPSMLIGETRKLSLTIKSSVAWIIGIALLLGSVGTVVTVSNVNPAIALAIAGAVFIAAAAWIERLEKRQRRFVANFATNSLRLDFASPIAGYPRTLVIPFDDVRGVAVMDQADGALCLVAEFELQGRTLQEVLAAFVPAEKKEELERVQRVLHGAFGLGSAPADSPAFDPNTTVNEESTFEP